MNADVRRVMRVTDRPSTVMVEGQGSWLWDGERKRYLDFVQGWAVNCLGHSPPGVCTGTSTLASIQIS